VWERFKGQFDRKHEEPLYEGKPIRVTRMDPTDATKELAVGEFGQAIDSTLHQDEIMAQTLLKLLEEDKQKTDAASEAAVNAAIDEIIAGWDQDAPVGPQIDPSEVDDILATFLPPEEKV
jgi:hypothetical protein